MAWARKGPRLADRAPAARPDVAAVGPAVGPWAERLPGPEMGPEWPGLGKGHGSPAGPRPRGRAHSGGEARRGDKEAEASVPVKRGVKELYVQILSLSIKDCRDFERHKEVSCRTFVAKIFVFCCHLRIYIFDFCLRKLR